MMKSSGSMGRRERSATSVMRTKTIIETMKMRVSWVSHVSEWRPSHLPVFCCILYKDASESGSGSMGYFNLNKPKLSSEFINDKYKKPFYQKRVKWKKRNVCGLRNLDKRKHFAFIPYWSRIKSTLQTTADSSVNFTDFFFLGKIIQFIFNKTKRLFVKAINLKFLQFSVWMATPVIVGPLSLKSWVTQKKQQKTSPRAVIMKP